MPATVLFFPAPGDIHELLAEGLCGARPPLAYRDLAGHLWTGQHASLPTGLVLAWKGEYADEGIGKLVLALAYSVHALKNVRKARIRGATFTYQPMLGRWMLEFVACDHGGWTRWSKAWSSDDLDIPYGREPWLHALVAACQKAGLGTYDACSLSDHAPAPPPNDPLSPNIALGEK